MAREGSRTTAPLASVARRLRRAEQVRGHEPGQAAQPVTGERQAGDPALRRTYQDDFTRAARKAGLPKQFIPHSLRHYFASTALARGIPITDVSQWLGHRSIEVTYRIYRHLMPSAWDQARATLDQAYLEAMAAGPACLAPEPGRPGV
jgi:integrase